MNYTPTREVITEKYDIEIAQENYFTRFLTDNDKASSRNDVLFQMNGTVFMRYNSHNHELKVHIWSFYEYQLNNINGNKLNKLIHKLVGIHLDLYPTRVEILP